MTKKDINTWRILISQGKLEEAILKMNKKKLDKFLTDDLIVLSSRFQRLKQSKNNVGIGFDEINKETNSINIAILDLLRMLEVHCVERGQNLIEYPKYCEHVSRMLYEDEIQKKLNEMKGWEVKETEIPSNTNQKGSELVKTYKFDSFLHVIEFMAISAKYMEQINHHPHWDNIWRSLTIRLSTWNIAMWY